MSGHVHTDFLPHIKNAPGLVPTWREMMGGPSREERGQDTRDLCYSIMCSAAEISRRNGKATDYKTFVRATESWAKPRSETNGN